MKKRNAVLVLATVLVALSVVVPAQAGKKAPDFTLKTSDGKVVKLSKLKGKVVVINFWATWCGPCRSEIPAFNELYKQYAERGVEFIGISVDEGGWSDVKPFVEKMHMAYPVVLGDAALTRLYGGVDAIPTTFVVDRDGFLVERHIGSMNKQTFEALFTPYL